MIKVKNCGECKFHSECKRLDKIQNTYGGLECVKIWSKEDGE